MVFTIFSTVEKFLPVTCGVGAKFSSKSDFLTIFSHFWPIFSIITWKQRVNLNYFYGSLILNECFPVFELTLVRHVIEIGKKYGGSSKIENFRIFAHWCPQVNHYSSFNACLL